jgi:hypothetical protein
MTQPRRKVRWPFIILAMFGLTLGFILPTADEIQAAIAWIATEGWNTLNIRGPQ